MAAVYCCPHWGSKRYVRNNGALTKLLRYEGATYLKVLGPRENLGEGIPPKLANLVLMLTGGIRGGEEVPLFVRPLFIAPNSFILTPRSSFGDDPSAMLYNVYSEGDEAGKGSDADVFDQSSLPSKLVNEEATDVLLLPFIIIV